MNLRKVAAGVAASGLVSAAALASMTGTAFAYGSADQPVAQVEISGNCDNPSVGLCQEVGLGGVWAWAELDTDAGSGTADSPSPMDATIAFCGHQTAGEPNGGYGHPDPIGVWYRVDSLSAALAAGASPFFNPSTSYDSYYVLDFFPGSGADDFIVVVPALVGHYTLRLAPAASLQTQVAP